MKRRLTVLFVFINASVALAHLDGIADTVVNEATDQPIPGVTIQLEGTGKATLTNELGQYRFAYLVADKQ